MLYHEMGNFVSASASGSGRGEICGSREKFNGEKVEQKEE